MYNAKLSTSLIGMVQQKQDSIKLQQMKEELAKVRELRANGQYDSALEAYLKYEKELNDSLKRLEKEQKGGSLDIFQTGEAREL